MVKTVAEVLIKNEPTNCTSGILPVPLAETSVLALACGSVRVSPPNSRLIPRWARAAKFHGPSNLVLLDGHYFTIAYITRTLTSGSPTIQSEQSLKLIGLMQLCRELTKGPPEHSFDFHSIHFQEPPEHFPLPSHPEVRVGFRPDRRSQLVRFIAFLDVIQV